MHALSLTSACFPTLYPNTELHSLGGHTHAYSSRPQYVQSITQSELTTTVYPPVSIPLVYHSGKSYNVSTYRSSSSSAYHPRYVLSLYSVSSSVYSSRPLEHRTKHPSNVLSDSHNDPLYILQSDLHTVLTPRIFSSQAIRKPYRCFQ